MDLGLRNRSTKPLTSKLCYWLNVQYTVLMIVVSACKILCRYQCILTLQKPKYVHDIALFITFL